MQSMFRLKSMVSKPQSALPIFTEDGDWECEKRRRISTFSDDERKAFEWFRQGYTARWTAETMLLNRKTSKRLFSSLFRKLGVANEAELCRLYRTAPLRPEDVPEVDRQ